MFRSIASRLCAAAVSATGAAAAKPTTTTTDGAATAVKSEKKTHHKFIGRNKNENKKKPQPRAIVTVASDPLPRNAGSLRKQITGTFIGAPNTARKLKRRKATAAVDSVATNVNKFAVVSLGNLQYKVSVGDVISAQRMQAAVGSRIALKKVLVVGGQRFTAVGRPLLANCRVVAEVEEHKRFKGILNYTHFKGRHLNKLNYSEHAVTMLRILEVSYNPQIVGEVDRSTGILLQPQKTKSLGEPAPACYYADELPAVAPAVNGSVDRVDVEKLSALKEKDEAQKKKENDKIAAKLSKFLAKKTAKAAATPKKE